MNKNRETLMKFISAQNQKVQDDISKQGYKDNSPYRNNPFNIIQGTPQGTSITMDNVSKRLYATDNQGNSKLLEPNSGQHFFPGSEVKETVLAKYGGLLNKTITCSNCGWSWKAADGGNDISTCHKCGAENKIMQEGGPITDIKNWFNQYIQTPRYKENLENSGYQDVDAEIAKRLSNINKTKYIVDENRLGTYYNPGSRYIHHAPLKDIENWEGNAPESESILAHEFGHSGVAKGHGTRLNKYDIEQLGSRNKNKKSYPQENYADQKALQYEAAKLGIYNPGIEEFTQEHLNKLKNTGHKSRALENYSDEDLIWLMNNIAQVDNQSQLPIAQIGGENMYTVSGDQPLIIPSQGSYPFDYNKNLPVNEAGMPYITNTDGKKVLLSSSMIVPRKDEFGKQLTRNQIAYNQDRWNDQKEAYSPVQDDFNAWKNNAKNTQQGYFKPQEYYDLVKKFNKLPDVGQQNLETCKANKRGEKKGSCVDEQTRGGDSLKDIKQYGGQLPKAQKGKQVKYGTPEYEQAYNRGEVVTDEGVRSPIALDEVVIQQSPTRLTQYKNNYNISREEYIAKKKDEYIKNLGKTGNWFGISQSNFPERVEKEINQNYDYDRNTYALEQFAKQKGFDLSTRGEWIENLSPRERKALINSKYSAKLNPNEFSNTLSGVQQLYNTVVPEFLQPNFQIPGLTPYENYQDKESALSALKVFSALNIPGNAIANAAKNSTTSSYANFRETPALGAQRMGNVSEVESMAVNPISYAGMEAIPQMLYNAPKTIGQGLQIAGRTLGTEEGLLSNAYKINPKALKENPEMFLYRARPVGQNIDMNMAAQLRAKEVAGEPLTWYQRNLLNPQTNPEMLAREKYYGQWFEKDPSRLDFYINPGTRNFADNDAIEILRTRLPKSEAAKLNISQFPDAKVLSASPETEFILPENMINSAERFPESNWQQLIQEDKAFNKPHWWRGFNKPIETPSVSNVINQVDSVTPKSWQLQELPGLHLKSTISDGVISKIVEPKTGLVNVEQALGIIGKESGGADKVGLIKQALGENIPKKMDYNEFRKIVQDQLIPLEQQFSIKRSDFGIESIGYTPKVQGTAFDKFSAFMNTPLSELFGKPKLLENKTIIFGNANKFGRGSSAHGNPEETLGHIHFLIDSKTPNTLTVTQIQSDAFQGTHRMMPKSIEDAIIKLDDAKGIKKDAYETFGDDPEKWKDVLDRADKNLNLEENHIKNFMQKSLLDKNHQERYIQELVDYAGKRGDINKVRIPTSETAVKIQNYTKDSQYELESRLANLEYRFSNSRDGIIIYNDNNGGRYIKDADGNYLYKREFGNSNSRTISEDEFNNVVKGANDEIARLKESLKNHTPDYTQKQKTILKKYSEQPKLIKKLFGQDAKIVKDSKGNTWYEFDIPETFKQGKGEIQAFNQGGELPKAQFGLPIASTIANKIVSWFSDDEKKPVVRPVPVERTFHIKDPRTIRATTQQPIRPTADLLSGTYNSVPLDKTLREAKRRGLSKNDMWNLAGMALAETGLGNKSSNIGQVVAAPFEEGTPGPYEFVDAYINKMKEADKLGIKDPAMRLQIYNGTGPITPDTEKSSRGYKMQKAYGVPLPKEGISMKKRPLYGINVLDAQNNVLKKNPEFVRYMDSIYKAPVYKQGGITGTKQQDPLSWFMS